MNIQEALKKIDTIQKNFEEFEEFEGNGNELYFCNSIVNFGEEGEF